MQLLTNKFQFVGQQDKLQFTIFVLHIFICGFRENKKGTALQCLLFFAF